MQTLFHNDLVVVGEGVAIGAWSQGRTRHHVQSLFKPTGHRCVEMEIGFCRVVSILPPALKRQTFLLLVHPKEHVLAGGKSCLCQLLAPSVSPQAEEVTCRCIFSDTHRNRSCSRAHNGPISAESKSVLHARL